MIRYENCCCGCAVPGYPCTAPNCSNLNVPFIGCDECGTEDEVIYNYDGQELCLDCILEILPKVEESVCSCSECDNTEEILYKYEDLELCEECLIENLDEVSV